jgi:hypothetical protein
LSVGAVLPDNIECLHITRTGLRKIRANKETENVSLDSCYTEDFIDRVNDHDFVGNSDYSNEIFLYYYTRLMEYCALFQASNSSRCDVSSRLLDKVLFSKARLMVGHEVSFWSRIPSFIIALAGFIISAFSMFLLSFFLPFYLVRKKGSPRSSETYSDKKSVFMIRSKAAYQKCRIRIEASESAVTFFDNYGDLNVPGLSIYSVISLKNIFALSIKSAFYALRDIKSFVADSRHMLDATCALTLLPKYAKRISHKAVYEACFKEVVRLVPEADFFTGDKDDRFALMQTRICKREKRRLFCLPHGLEYGFRFPGGLSATTFYCFTPEAAGFLNNLYNEKKFVYSEAVVDEMYGIGFGEQEVEKVDRLCFFTEPRDPEVNHEIVKSLMEKGVNFSLKLHPLESSEDYRKRFPEVEQIEDFNDAIGSSTCLARKSTILLEASRRGARSIAVLISEKDRVYVMKIFPSLCSKNILRAFTFDELHEML